MDRALKLARIALAFAGAIAFVIVGGLGLWYGPPVATRAVTALDGVNGALATVNRPKTGTLAEIDATARDTRVALDNVNKAAIHERLQLAAIDADRERIVASATGLLDALHDQAGHVGPVLDSAKASEDALTARLQQAGVTETQLNRAIADMDARINDPAITKTLDHVEQLSDHASGVAGATEKMANHVESVLDNPHKQPLWLRILPSTLKALVQAYFDRVLK
jgi:hypothetical protein